MGVWGEGTAWCLCSGGGRVERLKCSIFVTKGPALAAIISVSGGGGAGFLIHRNLLLTTHTNLPSFAAAEAAEIRLNHGRLPAKLVPQRFFITSPVLDLTIVGLDLVDIDTTSHMQQAQYLKTFCNPSLDLGSAVYFLGYTDKKELMIGEGKIVIATDNLIKLSTDGVTWCPGSAGFDVQGNLAFMVCDPMKLASSPTARSTASSSSSLSWKKDNTTQFGIPIPIICDWLHQHWEGNLDEVSEPRLPLMRLMSSGQRSENSVTSFTRRQIFKATEDENDDLSSSSQTGQPSRCQPGSSISGNAKVSHDESPVVDLRSSHDRAQGIPTPEIFESPKLTFGPVHMKENAPVQLLDINFPPKAPTSIFLPLPLKQMLNSEKKAEEPRPANQSRLNDHVLQETSQAKPVAYYKLPPVGTWQDDHGSEVQSSSSLLEVSEMQNDGDGFSCGEETMYSAETMESRNIPSPRENTLKPVGRSQSCVSYNRWTSSPRNSVTSKASLHKQNTLIPVRKTNLQTSALPPKGHDFCSPTVSSSMKKRNSTERPPRPRQNVVQVSPRWMF